MKYLTPIALLAVIVTLPGCALEKETEAAEPAPVEEAAQGFGTARSQGWSPCNRRSFVLLGGRRINVVVECRSWERDFGDPPPYETLPPHLDLFDPLER